MDRVYQANAIETPPSTTASSGSYPTAGNKASGQLATVPGPYWFYSITEEIRNALIAAGVTPDAAKVNQLAEALGKFLPLSGGTMTGVIKTSSGISNSVDSGWLDISGATAWNKGAYLSLSGKDSERDGRFDLCAHDGTTTNSLVGRPDGALTWAGNDVITSAGGTINGELWLAQTAHFTGDIYKTSNNGRLHIGGGSNWDQGALLYLDGKDNDGGSGSYGGFQLQARNASGVAILEGRVDGTLTWHGYQIACVPNYNGGWAFTQNQSFTAPSNGLVMYRANNGTGWGGHYLQVNGAEVGYHYGKESGGTLYAFVKQGDTVYPFSSGSNAEASVYFFPMTM